MSSGPVICGGVGGARAPDANEAQMLASLKAHVEEKAGKQFSSFEPVLIRTQGLFPVP